MKRLAFGLLLLIMPGCGNSSENTPGSGTPEAAAKPAGRPADEAAAIKILGQINESQADYFRRNRRYALTYEELIEAHLMDNEPSKDATGYEVTMRPSADAGSYSVVAAPVTSSSSTRYFFTDKSGTIRAEQGKEASESSPQI